MIYGVYSVFDQRVKCYAQPFYAANNEVAARMFSDVVNDTGTVVGRHPSDFSLHRIGSFNDNLGEFSPDDSVNLGLAALYKEVVNASQS